MEDHVSQLIKRDGQQISDGGGWHPHVPFFLTRRPLESRVQNLLANSSEAKTEPDAIAVRV